MQTRKSWIKVVENAKILNRTYRRLDTKDDVE